MVFNPASFNIFSQTAIYGDTETPTPIGTIHKSANTFIYFPFRFILISKLKFPAFHSGCVLHIRYIYIKLSKLQIISNPMNAKIHLRKNEERRIKSGHLWVFSNEIFEVEAEPQ